MRIGLVLDDTLDTPDGVQQYVLGLGAWLSGNGHEVHYLVGNTTRTDLPNVHSLSRNMHVKFNGNRMSMPLPTSKRLLKQFLKDYAFDILHVQVPYSPYLAGRLLRLVPASTAVVGTFHILPYSRLVRLANRGLALMNKRSGSRFDCMLAVSEPAKQFAEAVYGYKNTQVVPNHVRLSQFQLQSKPAQNVVPTVVFLGRLVARKGAQHLLAAIAYIKKQQLFEGDFHVHIGGKGELLGSLQAFVDEHNLKDMVTFDGFIVEDQKAPFLAQADIAVFPSTSGESFGIVLLEAMAVAPGVVLAGNNPGYASVMTGLDGQLIEPADTVGFAAQLASWLSDPTKRVRAAQAQKAYVAQFDISVVGEQILAVYDTALQSRP